MPSNVRADWILPIAGPPIPGGSITIDGNTIVAVHAAPVEGAVDLGRVALLPALVNAHTHLELSYLRGRIPRAACFTDWVQPLLAARRTPPDPELVASEAAAAIEEARASGTGFFGDVSNSLAAMPALRASRLPARVFHELLGFNVPDPDALVVAARARVDAAAGEPGSDALRLSLAPHAPYSVSPALFDAIRRDADRHDRVTTVHLAESREEVELLADGTGPWRALLEALGAWNPDWQPPRRSPVAYLHERGFLDEKTLVVHGVQCTAEDVSRVRDAGATLVSCPRSNAYVGAGVPPLARFYASGVPVAFGTDSLASVDDLNLFNELAQARRIAPEVSPRQLLESATRIGARALGFGPQCGAIVPRAPAVLISVRLPEPVRDVEEYLVSGIPASDVAWVSTEA